MNCFLINTAKNQNLKPCKTFTLMNVDHITSTIYHHTAQKMKFTIKDFFSKCGQKSNKKERVEKEILELNGRKSFRVIPETPITQRVEIYQYLMTNQQVILISEVILVCKREIPLKENYRPISLLPDLFKVFER